MYSQRHRARRELFLLQDETMTMALIQQAKKIRAERSFEIVGLTGGVFKNKRLNEYVNTLLQAEGFKVLMPSRFLTMMLVLVLAK